MTPREDAALTYVLIASLAFLFVLVWVKLRDGWDRMRGADRDGCRDPRCALCNPHPWTDR